MPKQWLRLYKEIISDPKVMKLAPEQRWMWIHLLCLALDHDGVIRIAKGIGYSQEDLARETGLSVDLIAETETWFETVGMLTIDESRVMRIRKWDTRQFSSDYSTERVRRFRERQSKRDNETERNVSETPPEQNRAEQNRDKSANALSSNQGQFDATENDRVEYKRVIETWNEMLGDVLPVVKKTTEQRRKAIRARWKEYGGFDGITELFEKVRASKFLTGRKTDFRATFDFVMGPKNAAKIFDGNYDDKSSEPQPNDHNAILNAEAAEHSDHKLWREYQRGVLAGKIEPGFVAWLEGSQG